MGRAIRYSLSIAINILFLKTSLTEEIRWDRIARIAHIAFLDVHETFHTFPYPALWH